jgi:hypothetical protein
LIAGTLLGGFFSSYSPGIDPLGDIRALTGEGIHDVDAIGMEDIVVMGVSDFSDGGADQLVVVEFGTGGNFPCDDYEIRFNKGLTSDAADWILLKAGIKNGI